MMIEHHEKYKELHAIWQGAREGDNRDMPKTLTLGYLDFTLCVTLPDEPILKRLPWLK